MCYINGIKVSLSTYLEYKKIQKELRHINSIVKNRGAQRGFEYGDWPVLKTNVRQNDWDVVAMQWGFLPGNVPDAAAAEKFRHGYKNAAGVHVPGFTTLNAKGEELLLPGKMFRHAALNNRCLILSSGFYEHRHIFEKNKITGALKKTATKFPYHIIVPSKAVFMMAGIYNTWTDRNTGESKDTFALVTTKSNKLMEKVHNSKMRMPVILTDELAEKWTDPDLTEQEIGEIATYRFPSQLMAAYPVRKTFLEETEPHRMYIENDVPELVKYNYEYAL